MYYITPDDYKTANKNGIKNADVYRRVYTLGWTIKRAITEPIRNGSRDYKYINQAKKNGISKKIYYQRLRRGWSKDKAAKTKVRKYKRCKN